MSRLAKVGLSMGLSTLRVFREHSAFEGPIHPGARQAENFHILNTPLSLFPLLEPWKLDNIRLSARIPLLSSQVWIDKQRKLVLGRTKTELSRWKATRSYGRG